MSGLVFLDTETTGLDPALHEVWEIALADEDGEVDSYFLAHSGVTADPRALELNGYRERYVDFHADEARIIERLEGATLVCSNPAFDTAFLRARWGREPWHHRKIDIATYAMPALGADRPVGLAKLAEFFGVAAPDHSAAGDVAVMRECFMRLSAVYGRGYGVAS